MNGWQNVIGHEWAVGLLATAIRHDRIGHAYLLTGPNQIGKTTLARTFAQALNCLEEEAAERPCGRCRACRLIAADRHPDVRLLAPEVSARGKETIKIDHVRTLQQDLNLTATEARYKVAILRRFESANPSAANAFLKTLEEPPNNVILLLTATEADTLLPTITSRCRTVNLRPLPARRIAAALVERWQVGVEQAERLSHLADGRLGWAIGAAQEPSILSEREDQLATLQSALTAGRVGRFMMAEKLAKTAETLPALLQSWLSWWRDLALLAHHPAGAAAAISNVDNQAELQRLAQLWPTERIVSSLRQTEQALWQLERNANTRLVLENLFLVYPPSSDAGR